MPLDPVGPIERLQHLNRLGDYRQVLRDQMIFDSDDDGAPNSLGDREVQLAVALQHAGFYLLAYNAYLAAKALAEEHGGYDARFRARIELQLAVLDERLGRLDQASARMESVRSTWSRALEQPTIHIAQMTDADWRFVTSMKINMARQRFTVARAELKESRGYTQHHRDWFAVFDAVLRLQNKNGAAQISDFVATIMSASERYRTYDAPGEPWIPLFAAPFLARLDRASAIELLQGAAQRAERMGKYFLVAAIHEALATFLANDRSRHDEADLSFRKALVSYGRCQLATHQQIRSRLAKLGRRIGLDGPTIADLAVRSSSLLLDRSEVRFSQLLSARSSRSGNPPEREFELFVEKWAPTRYPGRLMSLDPGEVAADVAVIREAEGLRTATLLQAKHYKSPRTSVPKRNPLLREWAEKHGARVEKYIFVVTTSSPDGWKDDMWHAETTRALRNVVTDLNVDVRVVTEPELQTDVVLNDHLMRWLLGG